MLPQSPHKIPLGAFKHYDHLPGIGVRDLSVKSSSGCQMYDATKRFRKYHGKKILSRKNMFQISDIHSSTYHYVSVKNYYLFSATLAKSPQVHVRDLSIVAGSLVSKLSRPLLPKALLSNQLSHCKRINSINIQKYGHLEVEPTIFSKIRTLNNLRSLTLSITEDGLLRMYKYFIRLESVQKLDLTICKDCSGETTKVSDSIVKEFYTKLLDCECLTSLGLNLEESEHMKKPKFIAILLDKIANVRIPFFRIYLGAEYPSEGNIEGLQSALKSVDLLTIINTSMKPLTWDLIDSCPDHHMIKANRMLCISLTNVPKPEKQGGEPDWGMSPSECADSSEIFKMMVYPYYILSVPISSDGLCNVTGMKSLSLSFHTSVGTQALQGVKNLTNLLKTSTSLEQLTLFSIKLGNCGLHDESNKREKEALFSSFTNLTQLKYFKFYGNIAEEGLNCLSGMLAPLRNLEKFVLNTSAIIMKESNKKSKFFIAFPECNKLTELKINIPEISLESLIEFFETVSKLEELTKFSIEVINLNGILEKEPEKVMIIMDALSRMHKLRGINIKTISATRGIGCMAGLRPKTLTPKDVEMKRNMRNQIRKSMLKMFDKNGNLESFLCNIFDFTIHLVR